MFDPATHVRTSYRTIDPNIDSLWPKGVGLSHERARKLADALCIPYEYRGGYHQTREHITKCLRIYRRFRLIQQRGVRVGCMVFNTVRRVEGRITKICPNGLIMMDGIAKPFNPGNVMVPRRS